MKGEIEKKNNFNKRKKKRIRTKFIKIIYHKIRLNDEIKNKQNIYKSVEQKNNKKNKEQIEK